MSESLEQKLRSWDGIHMDHLVTIYTQHSEQPNFFQKLIELTESCSDLQDAATWIIKHHFDNGQSIQSNDLKRFSPFRK